MDNYILNPAYYLRKDNNRIIFCNREMVNQSVVYEDFFTFIHPLNAQMLAFFNGEDDIETVKINISKYIGPKAEI